MPLVQKLTVLCFSSSVLLSCAGGMAQASNSYIREVAISPLAANNLVLGGFDDKLNFLDLNRPDCPYVRRLDMQSAISSVKWSPFLQGQAGRRPAAAAKAVHSRPTLSLILSCVCLFSWLFSDACVSCCLDEGKFYMFDARTSVRESAYFLDLKKEDLFTHERYSDAHLLLGFGDGHFKHIDMRAKDPMSASNNAEAFAIFSLALLHRSSASSPLLFSALPLTFLYRFARLWLYSLHEEQDPFVQAIGNIEFNTHAGAFVISGYTESVRQTNT